MCRGRSQVMVCTCPSRTPYTSPQSCSRSRSCTCRGALWWRHRVRGTCDARSHALSSSRVGVGIHAASDAVVIARRLLVGANRAWITAIANPSVARVTRAFTASRRTLRVARTWCARRIATGIFERVRGTQCAFARRSRGAGGTIILAVGLLIAAKT
jgi:hypothetical protein